MNATKSSLPTPRRRLVELMQLVNFGRIEGLVVKNGDPVIDDDARRTILEVKFCGDNGPRNDATNGDFVLKQQVIELFDYFERVQNARINVLTIKHGLLSFKGLRDCV